MFICCTQYMLFCAACKCFSTLYARLHEIFTAARVRARRASWFVPFVALTPHPPHAMIFTIKQGSILFADERQRAKSGKNFGGRA
jgi:hypothetical protein